MCICCCFISSKHHRVAVVSVYSSPSTSLKDAISELGCVLSQLLLHTNHIILAGDFNINLLGNSGPVIDYMNLLSDFGLLQHVSEPTCISKTSNTLIDHVISSTPLLATNSVQAVGISDHRIQIVDLLEDVSPEHCGFALLKSVIGIKCSHRSLECYEYV